MREYFDTIQTEIMSNSIFELLYVVLSIFYLFNLNDFNHSVIGVTDPIHVMFKDDGKAWWLLGFALILTFVAGFLFWYHVKKFLYVSGYSMLTLLIYIAMLIVFTIFIFVAINNPILRMAIVLVFSGSVVVTVISS